MNTDRKCTVIGCGARAGRERSDQRGQGRGHARVFAAFSALSMPTWGKRSSTSGVWGAPWMSVVRSWPERCRFMCVPVFHILLAPDVVHLALVGDVNRLPVFAVEGRQLLRCEFPHFISSRLSPRNGSGRSFAKKAFTRS